MLTLREMVLLAGIAAAVAGGIFERFHAAFGIVLSLRLLVAALLGLFAILVFSAP